MLLKENEGFSGPRGYQLAPSCLRKWRPAHASEVQISFPQRRSAHRHTPFNPHRHKRLHSYSYFSSPPVLNSWGRSHLPPPRRGGSHHLSCFHIVLTASLWFYSFAEVHVDINSKPRKKFKDDAALTGFVSDVCQGPLWFLDIFFEN